MRVFYLARRHFLVFLLPTLLVCPALFLMKTLYGLDAVTNLTDKVIIIDAGHGGIDPGANRPGVAEKDINLAISLELKEVLNRYGAKVVLSRQSDIELSPACNNEQVRGRYHRDLMARAEMAEESDADLFISIHANAVSNAQRHGAEVFYSAKSAVGKQLAESIQAELCTVTQTGHLAKNADYFVLRRNKIPAVLIEAGYITNPAERQLLQTPDYQHKLAEAIAKGISTYYHQG